MTGPSVPLAGSVAVVTGSARGIGAAVAEALHGAGAIVVGVDALGGHGCMKVDLSDRDAVETVVPRVVKTHGRLDILVNNAGFARHGAVSSIDPADLDGMWAVNVRAPILLTRDAMPLMAASGGGDIVNVISTAGLRGEPGESAYCSTKFAMRGFTEAAAEEGRVCGVRVQGIYPAGVDTAFWDDAVADAPSFIGTKRFLSPRDVASQILGMVSAPPEVEVTTLVMRHRGDADTAAIEAKLARVGR